MRNRIPFIAIIFINLHINCFTQASTPDNSNIISKAYDRCALTMLWNNTNTGRFTDLQEAAFKKALLVPAKYDNNTLNYQSISVNGSSGSNNQSNILSELRKNNIASSILSYWFNQQPDGSFKMDRIAERGQYNATLDDINQAMLTKRGLAMVQDAGLNLIDKSHILVFDITNIKTMQEIAKEQNRSVNDGQNTILANSANPAKKNGFRADVLMYLFKIEFNDSIAALFYNDYWVNKSDDQEIKQLRKEKLSSFDIPVIYITKFSSRVTSSQINAGYAGAPSVQKSRQELFTSLVSDGVSQNMEKMERNYSGCAVKSRLHTVKPKITAKIGRKEGLYVDQRYFVYEDVVKSSGKTMSVRRGVIRAKSVSNNKGVASGEMKPSQFYQTGGRKLNAISMFIAQKNDMGIGFSAGYSSGAITGPMFKLELNISQFIDKTTQSNIKPGFKLYGDAGFETKEYFDADQLLIDDAEDNEYSFIYFTAGFAKEYYFARHFQITPYLGYVYEMVSWSFINASETAELSVHGAGLGIRFGMNITPGMQICYSANLHAPIFGIDDKNSVLNNESISYTDIFDDRSGSSNIFQVRIIF